MCSELARGYLLLGRGPEAIALADEVLPIAERLELIHEAMQLLVTRGAALAGVGRVRESIVVLMGGVESCRANGLNDVELRARVNLSYAAAAEDPELAYRTAREGVDLARHLGMRGYSFYLLSNAAELAIRIGDWDWILPEVEEAAQLETDHAAQMRLAEIRGLRGLDAWPALDRLLEQVLSSSEIQAPASVLEVRAIVALSQGDFRAAVDAARDSYQRNIAPDATALQTASRAGAWLGDRTAVAHAAEVMAALTGRVPAAMRRESDAVLHALDGRRPEALVAFIDAIRRWRDLGYEFEAAMCELNLATMLGTDVKEAAAAADDAAAIFDRLGARPLNELLSRARTASSARVERSPVSAGEDAAIPASREIA
jgi:tetratricopeptide (TPR) repeat protein